MGGAILSVCSKEFLPRVVFFEPFAFPHHHQSQSSPQDMNTSKMSFSSNEKLFIQAGSFTCVWIFQLDDCQVSNGGNSEPASPQIGIDIPVRGTEALARAPRGDPVHEAFTDDQKSGLRVSHDSCDVVVFVCFFEPKWRRRRKKNEKKKYEEGKMEEGIGKKKKWKRKK